MPQLGHITKFQIQFSEGFKIVLALEDILNHNSKYDNLILP